MSFLARIASRAVGPMPGTAPAVLRPKGFAGALTRKAPLRRQEEEEQVQPLRRQEEEEEAQPLRRQEEEEEAQALRRQEEEEEAQPLRRQEEEEEEEVRALRRQEEQEEAQPLRRQEEEEEEEAQALRRQEEEEEAQPLRRQEEEEEEEAQPLRRQEEEEEEAQALRRQEEEEGAQPLRRQDEEEEAQTLRRLEDDPSRLDAENSPPPDELAGEPEPPTALAIRRRDTAAAIGEAAFPPGAAGEGRQPGGDLGFDAPSVGVYRPEVGFEPSQSFERPSVTIDQLDVVIHEPAPARSGATPMQARSRAVRARLLRRL